MGRSSATAHTSASAITHSAAMRSAGPAPGSERAAKRRWGIVCAVSVWPGICEQGMTSPKSRLKRRAGFAHTGKIQPASAISDCAVTHTGVWALVRE